MSEQLYVCENAERCENKPCKLRGRMDHSEPHKEQHCVIGGCVWFDGVVGSRCIPVASSTASDAQPATSTHAEPEANAVDPDVFLAREIAASKFLVSVSALNSLLIRLADKVEGKK